MKKAFLNLLAFFICSATLIQAQSSLGIDTSNYTIPATVNFNGQYTFKVHVKNYGPQAFSGTASISYAVDSSGTNINVDTLVSTNPTFSIAVNNEIPDSSIVTISPSSFRSGINTVVIWPRNSSAEHIVTHDSLRVQILVTGYSGIKNYTETKPIVFPNPMQSRLFITNKDPNFVIEQVRIFDVSGQIIYSEKFKGSIDVSKLTGGVYTLEFTDLKGNQSKYKVIKE